MSPARVPLRVRLGLPDAGGLLVRTRVAFLALTAANGAATVISMIFGRTGAEVRVISLVAAFLLAAAHWWTAHRDRPGVLDELAVAAAVPFASLALPDVTMTVSLIFSAVMFRSLYGSHRLAVLRTAAYIGLYAISLHVGELTGRLETTTKAALLLPVPAILMSMVTMRFLFVAVQGRDAAAARQTILTSTATRLLAVSDVAAMAEVGWAGQRQLLAGFPAEAFLLEDQRGFFAAVERTGERPGAVVPYADVRAAISSPDREPVLVPEPARSLTALAPHARWWYLVPTGRDEATLQILVLASEQRLPADLVRSSQLLMRQTALAFNALAHRAELHRRASHDALTGLANRDAFLDRLGERATRSDDAATAVFFLDLDGFKAVNDERGHRAGDQLLTVVADRLSAGVRPDDLVARLGGDEFAVLLPSVTGLEETRLIADRLERALREPVVLRSGTVSIGVSIGVRVVRGPFHPDDVLNAADDAMYRIKAKHRTASVAGRPGASEPELRVGA